MKLFNVLEANYYNKSEHFLLKNFKQNVWSNAFQLNCETSGYYLKNNTKICDRINRCENKKLLKI